MSRRQDLAQWPCSGRKLLGRELRVNFFLSFSQRTRDEMRSGRQRLIQKGLHRMQKQLLCSIRA